LRRGWVLSLTWVSWFWSHGTRVGVPALTPFIRQHFSASTAETAAVPGLLNTGFYVSTFFSGLLPARAGFRNVVVLAAVGSGLALMLASFSDNIWLLYISMALTGLFLSLHLPSAIPWLGQLYKGARQGFYIGVHESAAPSGQTLGPVILSLLYVALSHTYSLAVWAVIPLIAGIALVLVSRETATLKVERGDGGTAVARRAPVALLTAVTVANLVGNLGVVAIIPLHLVDSFGLDKAYVAFLVGLSRALGIVGQPVGGILHDKYGFTKVAIAVTALNFASNAYLAFAPYTLAYPLAMTLQATATAMYFPILYSYIVRLQGPAASKSLGRIMSVAGIVGPTTTPILAGFLAENLGYTAALSYPLVLAGVGLATLLLNVRRL
jgi:MFS family permease